MQLRSLKLRAVRNLAPLVLEPGARFNIFFGDNGQGKTNLLEAIYALCTLRSFRTQRLAELIAIGQEGARIEAVLEREGLERHYDLALAPRGRQVRIDGKSVRPIRAYFGEFNVVLFAPEDLQVPRGSPSARRRFLDRAVFNRERGYLANASDYERALRSRNALLRNAGGRSPSPDVLAAFDEQVAVHGAKIVASRRAYVAAILPGFSEAFAAIGRSPLLADLRYEIAAAEIAEAPDDELPAALRAALGQTLRRDIARGGTSVGPHRDDLRFVLGGQSAASFASQGQLRALVLAFKTAEMSLLEEAENEPILLLDDVSSELDDTRNRALFEFLRERKNQCFITTTAARHVLLPTDRVDFAVRAGLIEKV